MKFFALLSYLICLPLFAQSTGPIYNFNFGNQETITPPAPAKTTEKQTLTTPIQEKKSPLKDYFSRSLLNSQDNFVGIMATYMTGLSNSKSTPTHYSLSVNIVLQSLWGFKVIATKREEIWRPSGIDVTDDDYNYYNDYLNEKSYKFGVNKFLPFSNYIALELGAFVEKGKISRLNEFPYEAFDSNFYAGSAVVGLNFFSGNLVGGLTFEQRFGFNAKNKYDWKEAKNKNSYSANVGLYF